MISHGTHSVRNTVRHLLDELEASSLVVCKVPSRKGGYIRIPVSVNAEWYQHFCRKWMGTRRRYPKPRTIIKRCHTLRALRAIANGEQSGVYVERLMEFVEEWTA